MNVKSENIFGNVLLSGLSAMIEGAKGEKFFVNHYSEEQAPDILKQFIEKFAK